MTDIADAIKHAGELALSLGVRMFLYRDATGRPVYHAILPADPSKKDLELVQTFEPPERTVYDSVLPEGAPPAS